MEAERIDLVLEELSDRFGGITFHPEQLRGAWLHHGERFEENNVRLVVDVEDSLAAVDFFVRYKQTLKERFRQIDIWIISYQIQIT